MKWKGHMKINFIGMIGYLFIVNYFRFDPWSIPRCVILWMVFSMEPDDDLKFDLTHRNWFFHSLILPLVFTLSFWGIHHTSFSLFVYGLHLLCDIYQERGKEPRGTYLIAMGKVFDPHPLRLEVKTKRLSPRETVGWLAQGLFGIMMSILLEVL
jgi:hypothetical protein